MPIKNGTCGIYAITTPHGSAYVGSSICIQRRFVEHKSLLKRNCHHSSRLQKAYNKHGDKLVYSIVCECDEASLVENEQKYIEDLGAKLNAATTVNNVWTNPETRKKFEEMYKTKEFKEGRSLIAKNISTRWTPVDCSDGEKYKNLTDAAQAYGLKASGIKRLVSTGQKHKRLNVKFKYTRDEWKEEVTPQEQMKRTMEKNGTSRNPSQETRKKMSEAKKGKALSPQCLAASVVLSSRPVVGKSIKTSEIVIYSSSMEAARMHNTGRIRTAAAQINKAVRGVKKSAYGYVWEYARA